MENSEGTTRTDLLSKALKEIRSLKSRLKAAETQNPDDEPVAIVGMSCRFPGGANTPEALWDLLSQGKHAITEIPANRMPIDQLFDEKPKTPGKISSRYGSFLSDVDTFDAAFFNISPREAAAMDPQQRLLLEVGFEALEDAGIVIEKNQGLNGGVFLGISGIDYALRLLGPGNENQIDPYYGSGTVFSAAAGRISYSFGLNGPCMAVDTACSSSLVAVHLAAQSLRRSECDFAIAAGVNLILGPSLSLNFSQSGLLSADGKTRAFDKDAAGYTRGEGCGVLIIKRLSDALKDNDSIWAIVRGSATNQDGHSGGLTVPSGSAQEAVIRSAIKNANLSPNDINYVEAHGTGTPLGDPIEVNTLGRVFSNAKGQRDRKLMIGSVKTNFGHLEAAAGMASLFKVILALKQREIPPHLHYQAPNPEFDPEALSFEIPTSKQTWPDEATTLRAGISGFSFSGSNAHLIIEEAPPVQSDRKPQTKGENPAHLLTISAKTPKLLDERIEALEIFARSRDAEAFDISELATTLNEHRLHFPHRAALIARKREDLDAAFSKLMSGKRTPLCFRSRPDNRRSDIAFLFSGQGSQYVGMGAALFEHEPLFTEMIQECDSVLQANGMTSIQNLLYPQGPSTRPEPQAMFRKDMFGSKRKSTPLDQTENAQPALFALEIALARLWISWGIEPSFVLGHSLGEYAAAHIAGVFSLEDGLRLVRERGRLCSEQCPTGKMATVFAQAATVEALSSGYSQIAIAAVNGPENLVLSGDTTEIDALLQTLDKQKIRYAVLPMTNGFHSPLIHPMIRDFRKVVEGIEFHKPQLSFVSNLSGDIVTDEVATAEYWLKHIQQQVKFGQGLKSLWQHGGRTLLEIGPDPTLLGLVQSIDLDKDASTTSAWVPSLQRGHDDRERMLRSAAELYVQGHPLQWSRLSAHESGKSRVKLPSMPWDKKRFWIERKDTTPKSETTQQAAPAPQGFYELEWSRSIPSPSTGRRLSGTQDHWLLIQPSDSFSSQLETAFKEEKTPFSSLKWSELVPTTGSTANTSTSSKTALDERLSRLWPENTITHILISWPTHSANIEGLSPLATTVSALVRLVEKCALHPNLFFLTRGANLVVESDQSINPTAGIATSLSETLRFEHPGISAAAIDLPIESEPKDLDCLIDWLHQEDCSDHQTAIRDGIPYACRLQSAERPSKGVRKLDPEAAYLISGGLGELGLLMAKEFVNQGARHLLLVGRSRPNSRANESLTNLQELGARIDFIQSDLTCPARLRTAVNERLNKKQRLAGILHAAGSLVVKPLHELSSEDWNEGLAGKAIGAWTLHEFSRDLEPDFFVLFSSTASIWSGIGLGAYSAGNRFLDGLAQFRQSQGKPTLVVNWAGWNAGGMHTEESLRNLRQMGIEPTPACKATEWVMQLIRSSHSQVVIGDINWNRFLPIIEANGENPLFEKLRPLTVPSASTKANRDLSSAAPTSVERTEPGITQYLREEFANSLGTSSEEIAPEDDLIGTGITSLMVMEVFNHVRQDFDLILYPREFYERPSVSELAPYLLEQLGAETSTPSVQLPALPKLPHVGEPKKIESPQVSPIVSSQKRSPAAFILSAPRSGSTLLRAMLAGHPQLFAPPELYLLPYNSLEHRQNELGDASLNQGLERCFMELMGIDAHSAKAVVAGLTSGKLSTAQCYEIIQNLIPNRLLIDKSPGYASDPKILARAEAIFTDAKYIHLIRHPLSVVESVVRMRMHALMEQSNLSPQAIADSNWQRSNTNIATFFESLPQERCLQVKYEDLVASPQEVMERVSDFLGIAFQDALLTPYDGKRMTDGLYQESIPAGDPNFLTHKTIDPKLAEVWKTIKLDEPLSQETTHLATALGYEIPHVSSPDSAKRKLPTVLPKSAPEDSSTDNVNSAPLSFAQQRLWFLDQLEGSNAVYNATRTLKITGTINREALRETFQAIMNRHSVLRTGFTTDSNGQPVQRTSQNTTLPLREITLESDDPGIAWKNAARLIEEETTQPFNLVQGPLWRITWIQAQSKHFELDSTVWVMGKTPTYQTDHREESLLVLTFHHSAYDGVSLERLFQEIEALYRKNIQAPSLRALRDLSCQYIDFSKWQREWHKNGGLKEQLAYWKDKLGDHAGRLEFPTDHPRPATQSYRGGSVYFELDATLRRQLELYCKERQLTPYVVTFAAFQILLARYSKQTDIPMGTLINNRRLKEFDALLGMFVNTLVIRGDWTGNPSFNDGVRRFAAVLEEAFTNQDAPFELLVEELHPERSLSHQPIFQIMFAMHNARVTFPDLPGIDIQALETERTHAKFDLNLILTPINDHYDAVIEFNRDLFEEDTINQLIAGYRSLMRTAIETPATKISDLPIMDRATLQKVDTYSQSTRAIEPLASSSEDHDSFIRQFEHIAAESANRTAVVFDSYQFSYRELNAMAERAANRLAAGGAGHATVVALIADRSPDFLATMLAIFKLNAIYLPLDPHHPIERIRRTLESADCKHVVIGQSASMTAEKHSFLTTITTQHWALEKITSSNEETNLRVQRITISKNDAAYVIFTSGSTGTPKGATVEQGGMLNHLRLKITDLGLNPTDIVVQNASQCFDISVWQFLSPLLVGATVHIYEDSIAHDPDRLMERAAQNQATILELVPAVMGTFLANQSRRSTPLRLSMLRWLIPTGEALPPSLCHQWFQHYPEIPLLNAYGPTECSDDVTHYGITKAPHPETIRMPIGTPVANTQIYILDERMNRVPPGVFGELFVGGAGVGRGYLRAPSLTANVFGPNPFSTQPGDRLYQTGDSGRFLANGIIEFAGRLDHQVKIRGFRIELGEIESAIRRSKLVHECVVIDHTGSNGEAYLLAYLAYKAGHAPDADGSAIRAEIALDLPDYMIPAFFFVLEALPLTPNGKIDRKALPEPDLKQLEDAVELILPRNPTEELLGNLWKDILGIKRLSIDESFFDLGGHSLLATQLINRANQLLKEELSVRDLFDRPTIRTLVAPLLSKQQATASVPRIVPNPDGEKIILSFSQERLWFLDQFEEKSATYNMSRVLNLKGPLNGPALQAAFLKVLERHDSLRTCFPNQAGQPIASCLSPEQSANAFTYFAHSEVSDGEERQSIALTQLNQQQTTPFDLATGPMIRIQLHRITEEEHLLGVTLHHIISDGWSLTVFVRELSKIYQATVDGANAQLEELPVRYSDYAAWQRDVLRGEELTRLRTFWLDYLKGAPPLLELPTDYPRPAVQRFCGAVEHFVIEPPLKAALDQLATNTESTLFMVVQTAFSVLLSRYSGQKDIVIGIPIANRSLPELEPLIGFFINTIALRTRLDGNPIFSELLDRNRRELIEVYEHQALPFEHLVEDLVSERTLGHNPIFQVMLVFQNAQPTQLQLTGIEIEPMPSAGNKTSKFDLLLTIEELEGELHCEMEYSTDLFQQHTIQSLNQHFITLLKGIVASPQTRVSSLPLLTAPEQNQVIREWNSTQRTTPKVSVIELFEQQAERVPDKIAAQDETLTFTYAELNARANRVARTLIEHKIGPEDVVCVLADRDARYLTVMLGILKAGAIFQGLDPSYPPSRLGEILEQSNLSAGFVEATHRPLLLAGGGDESIPWMDLDTALSAPPISKNLPARACLQNAAYLMYTSGTTGKPKGSIIEHGGMLNHIQAKNGDTKMGESDVIAQTASQRFDIFVYQFLAALILGAKVRIYPDDIANDPERLFERVHRDGITILEIVPSLMGMYLSNSPDENSSIAPLTPLRWLIPTGEALPPELCRKWFKSYPSIPLLNAYGHTETSDDVTHESIFQAPPESVANMSIGRPVLNTEIYILNEAFEPVPQGVVGQLFVGGIQVGRGYLNRPDLTAAVTLPDPFTRNPGQALYDSGDQARWLSDGRIEYVGRVDHMVKVRGNRIELGEIEAALLKHPSLSAAVVTAYGDKVENKELAAYVCPVKGTPLSTASESLREELPSFLKELLPSFMVPRVFMILPSMPLTANGKIDRKSLPQPEQSQAVSASYVAPETDTEKDLADLWNQILEGVNAGRHDDFFSLGGHSLLATQLASKIRNTFGVEFALRTLFEHPVLKDLADWLDGELIDQMSNDELAAALEELDDSGGGEITQ